MAGESLGQRLQRLRQAAEMSQFALADAAGIPVATLRNWEQDRREPKLMTAARVARALGVPLDELAVDLVADKQAPSKRNKNRRRK